MVRPAWHGFGNESPFRIWQEELSAEGRAVRRGAESEGSRKKYAMGKNNEQMNQEPMVLYLYAFKTGRAT